MKTLWAYLGAAGCMVGAMTLGSLLLFLAGVLLLVYGLLNVLDGAK